MAAWRKLRDLRDPDAFDAWLTRLAVNTCRSRCGPGAGGTCAT